MDVKKFVENTQTLIAKNDIESAVELLFEIFKGTSKSNAVTIFSTQYSDLKEKKGKSIIDKESEKLLLCQLTDNISNFLKDILKNPDNDILDALQKITDDFFNKYMSVPSPNFVTGKSKKEELIEKVKKFIDQIDKRAENIKNPDYNNKSPDDPVFHKNLVNSIAAGTCVLFIGPEISLAPDGNRSIHDVLFENWSNESDLKFDDAEGLPLGNYEDLPADNIKEYYKEQFTRENQIPGYSTYEKLAAINFPIIISATPDRTIESIYDRYNKPREFHIYNGESIIKTKTPEKNHPVIYNFLGVADDYNYDYIITYKQIHNYSSKDPKIKVPVEITDYIASKHVTNMLFVGYNFNRWYNRLALYNFNLNGSNKIKISSRNIGYNEITASFMHREFRITYNSHDCQQFVNLLYDELYNKHKREPHKQIIDEFKDSFIDNTKDELIDIESKIHDADSKDELGEQEKRLKTLERKYFSEQ